MLVVRVAFIAGGDRQDMPAVSQLRDCPWHTLRDCPPGFQHCALYRVHPATGEFWPTHAWWELVKVLCGKIDPQKQWRRQLYVGNTRRERMPNRLAADRELMRLLFPVAQETIQSTEPTCAPVALLHSNPGQGAKCWRVDSSPSYLRINLDAPRGCKSHFRGREQRIHRLLCFVVHGGPPAADHGWVAAHCCGNAWCCNPAHIRWARRGSHHTITISDSRPTDADHEDRG